MTYEDYIRSNRPIWVSGIALGILSLLPISILLFEGWHSGIPWAAFFAVQMAVLMPGIYLIRPRVFWIWGMIVFSLGVAGICTIEYYQRSAPDWMDAEIPKWIFYSIRASIRFVLGSNVVLGIIGWFTYFKRRRKHTTTA